MAKKMKENKKYERVLDLINTYEDGLDKYLIREFIGEHNLQRLRYYCKRTRGKEIFQINGKYVFIKNELQAKAVMQKLEPSTKGYINSYKRRLSFLRDTLPEMESAKLLLNDPILNEVRGLLDVNQNRLRKLSSSF